MKLSDTVSHFAKQTILDAYTGLTLFNGKFDIYDSSVRDSLTGGRRTLTVVPTVSIPARRVIKYSSDIFIIGDVISDSHNNEIFKKHLVLHPVDGLATIGTSADMLSGLVGTPVYTGKSWRKAQKEEVVSSELFNIFNFYVAKGESTSRNDLILLNGIYNRIQGIEDTTGGFVILVASELEADTVQTVSYTPASGSHDPVLDTKAVSASFNIQAFSERYRTSYRYTTPSAAKFEIGDIILTFLKTDVASPLPGDKLTVKLNDYILVDAVDDLNGAWEAHLRIV